MVDCPAALLFRLAGILALEELIKSSFVENIFHSLLDCYSSQTNEYAR
jgi:hypothetical protein